MLIRKLLNKICVYSLIGCFLMNPTVADAKDKSYYDIPVMGPGTTLACALGEYSDIKDIYFNGYVKSPPHAHDDRNAYKYHSEESEILSDDNWKYNISEELELEHETTDSSDGGYNGFPTVVYYDKAKNPVVKVYGDDIIKNPGYVLVDQRYIVYKLIYNEHGKEEAEKFAKTIKYDPAKPDKDLTRKVTYKQYQDKWFEYDVQCSTCGKWFAYYEEYANPVLLFTGKPVKEGECILRLEQEINGEIVHLGHLKLLVGPKHYTVGMKKTIDFNMLIMRYCDVGDPFVYINSDMQFIDLIEDLGGVKKKDLIFVYLDEEYKHNDYLSDAFFEETKIHTGTRRVRIYNKDKSLNFGEVKVNVSFTDLLSEHTGKIKLVERGDYIIYKESKNPTPLLSFSNEVDISGLETVLILPSGNNKTMGIDGAEFTKKGNLKVPKDIYMECLEQNRTFITLKEPLIVGYNYYYDYRYIYPVVPLDGSSVSNVWDVYPCHSLEEQKGKLPVVWFKSTTVTFSRK